MIVASILNYMLVASLFVLASFDDGAWKIGMDKDNIRVYTRKLDSSRFKEFRAEVVLPGTIDKFIELLSDIENYDQWLPDCKSAEIIERPDEDNITYHMKLKVPFPFQNRDLIQQISFNRIEKGIEIKIVNRPKRVEEMKNYVRMPVAFGNWNVRQINAGTIDVKFQYLADPGGDIPAWLVNSFIVKNPFQTLRNIREVLND